MLSQEVLKATGIHIALPSSTDDMKFYLKARDASGFNIFDMNKILSQLIVAGKFIASFDKDRVLVFGAQMNHMNAIKKFGELTGVRVVTQRLIPGALTNAQLPSYIDADLLIVSDPQNRKSIKPYVPNRYDTRAMDEASTIGIPIVGICDTDSTCSNLELVIPGNNKGSRAIATIFYLLTRSVLLARGTIKPTDDMPCQILDFETYIEPEDPRENEDKNDDWSDFRGNA